MLNALQRKNKQLVTAVWFKRDEIDECGCVLSCGNGGKVINVEFISASEENTTQPIQNLITGETTARVKTRFNYDYERFDELYLLGKRWQITAVRHDYSVAGNSLAMLKPQMNCEVTLNLTQLSGELSWTK